MTIPEQQTELSEAIRKHKEFLFPAVANYYQEPIALVRGEGEYFWTIEETVTSMHLAEF